MPGFLIRRLREEPGREAVAWDGGSRSYGWLAGRVDAWRRRLGGWGVGRGSVACVVGDFSAQSIALVLALVQRRSILVPASARDPAPRLVRLKERTQAEYGLRLLPGGGARLLWAPGRPARHPLYATLRRRGSPGIVLLTTGSTATPKAAVHDLSRLLERFRTPRRSGRVLHFFPFDHWGGWNTLLHTLSSLGVAILPRGRTPDAVCAAVARHRAEVLPVTPSFLSLLLLSGAPRRHDLSSLRVVSYGAEPMPDGLLSRLRAAIPGAGWVQTYGLSEAGVLRARPRAPGSPWLRIVEEGCRARVVEGLLQLRTPSLLAGYLDAPAPLTPDGWLETGDRVASDGAYLRVLGRAADVINVGGLKVAPEEVEAEIRRLPEVAEALVYGRRSPWGGQMVCARVVLSRPRRPRAFLRRLRRHCLRRLPAHMAPARVAVVRALPRVRGKLLRRPASP